MLSTATPFVRDPHFGRDPWLGPATPSADGLGVSHVYSGEDTLRDDISLLNPGRAMYASYIDNFGGYPELVARFGKSGAFLLSITIFGGKARCGDFEPGAMPNSQAAHWLDHEAIHSPGFDPWVYTNAGNWQAMNAVIGSRKVVRFSAHVGHGPHICGPRTCGFPQADWTQWDFTGPQGQNVDQSIGLVIPSPPKPQPENSGIAHFAGAYDLDRDLWSVHGEPGKDVKFAGPKATKRATVQIEVGQGGGTWDIHRLN